MNAASAADNSTAALPAWASIVIWISLGTSMIMFNKVLLTMWGFRYPCLLTTWHCVLASVLTQILARTTTLLPSVQKGVISRNDFFLRIMPMALCFAFGLVAGNMAYAYISLAYIQMIKAFTPVPLLLLSFVSGLEKPSLIVFVIVLVVSAGVTLSSVGELQFSAVGFFLQLSAVLVDCFRMVLMNLLLKDLNLDSLSLLYYTAPPSALLIFCGFLTFEAHLIHWDAFTPALCIVLVLNGLLAFSLNVAVIYLVSSTSAVVMSISGPLKDILIVLISVIIFHSPITVMQVGGFSVSLLGLYMYKEYKSDPKRAVEGCAALLSLLGAENGCCSIVGGTSTTHAAIASTSVTSNSSSSSSGSSVTNSTGRAAGSTSGGATGRKSAGAVRAAALQEREVSGDQQADEERGERGELELRPLLPQLRV